MSSMLEGEERVPERTLVAENHSGAGGGYN